MIVGYELHPACEAWPDLSEKELDALAEDIRKNGLHEPLTLWRDGSLLDGKNRARACERIGVEPATRTHDGDPYAFSASVNDNRRHATEIERKAARARLAALAAAETEPGSGGDRRSEDFKFRAGNLNEERKNAAFAKDVANIRAIQKHGTAAEQAAVMSGEVPIGRTADAVRTRRRPGSERAAPKRIPQSGAIAERMGAAQSPLSDALALPTDAARDAEIAHLKRLNAELELKLAASDARILEFESALADKGKTIGDLRLELQLAYEKAEEHHRLWERYQTQLREKDDTIEALETQLAEARGAHKPASLNEALAEAFPVKVAKAKRSRGRPKGDQPWLAEGITRNAYYQRRQREKRLKGRAPMGAEPPPLAEQAPPLRPSGLRRRRLTPPVSPATA
jgi:hypothetical protein